MILEESFVKKKLKKLKDRFPDIDVKQIEKELYPLEGGEVVLKVGKKKRKNLQTF